MTICGSFSQSNIPNGQQDAVADGYKNNIPPPINVTQMQDADGTWTVTAQWPPCPSDTTTTHSPNNTLATANPVLQGCSTLSDGQDRVSLATPMS
jgi:predicted acyl esterase